MAGILFILVTIPLARFTDALSRRSGWLEAMGGVAGVACRDDRPWRRRPREPVTDVGPAAADAGRVLERGVPVQVLGDPAEQRTRDFLRRLS